MSESVNRTNAYPKQINKIVHAHRETPKAGECWLFVDLSNRRHYLATIQESAQGDGIPEHAFDGVNYFKFNYLLDPLPVCKVEGKE